MKKTLLSLTISSIILATSVTTAYADYNFNLSVYKMQTKHSDVKVIQEALKDKGLLNIKNTTTFYGSLTQAAIKSFQRNNGLKVDGIAGKNTLAKMNSLGWFDSQDNEAPIYQSATLSKVIYKKGDRHSDVVYIQQALRKSGVFNYPENTTYFGSVTEKSVKAFQQKYGLKSDGIVGPNTIEKMKTLGLLNSNYSVTSRANSTTHRYGEYLDWWKEVNSLIPWGENFKVIDFKSGKSFMAKRTGGSNHADVEPLTTKDTQIMKEIWGGSSWARRPIIVEYQGRRIAASASGMPHAGSDSAPARVWTKWRSDGYGAGINYDSVKNNGMDGHFDIHFRNSTRHKDNKQDSQHQKSIKVSAGIIK